MNDFNSYDEVKEWLLSGETVSCRTNTYSKSYWSCHEGCCESEDLTIDEMMSWIEERADLEEIIK